MTKHKRGKQSRRPCPLCAGPPPNTGLPIAIPFGIPTYWSPKAALAIFEFVDEMRDIILSVYGTHIPDAAQTNRVVGAKIHQLGYSRAAGLYLAPPVCVALVAWFMLQY
jgi:hypothetical protein